jgi:hypothetical protein
MASYVAEQRVLFCEKFFNLKVSCKWKQIADITVMYVTFRLRNSDEGLLGHIDFMNFFVLLASHFIRFHYIFRNFTTNSVSRAQISTTGYPSDVLRAFTALRKVNFSFVMSVCRRIFLIQGGSNMTGTICV